MRSCEGNSPGTFFLIGRSDRSPAAVTAAGRLVQVFAAAADQQPAPAAATPPSTSSAPPAPPSAAAALAPPAAIAATARSAAATATATATATGAQPTVPFRISDRTAAATGRSGYDARHG